MYLIIFKLIFFLPPSITFPLFSFAFILLIAFIFQMSASKTVAISSSFPLLSSSTPFLTPFTSLNPFYRRLNLFVSIFTLQSPIPSYNAPLPTTFKTSLPHIVFFHVPNLSSTSPAPTKPFAIVALLTFAFPSPSTSFTFIRFVHEFPTTSSHAPTSTQSLFVASI